MIQSLQAGKGLRTHSAGADVKQFTVEAIKEGIKAEGHKFSTRINERLGLQRTDVKLK